MPDAYLLLQSSHKNLLDPNSLDDSVAYQHLFDGCSKVTSILTGIFRALFKNAQISLSLPKFAQPELNIFSTLSHTAKRICDATVIDIEETLDEQLQVLSFETLGSIEDRNSALLYFLRINHRLHSLRRDFLRANTRRNLLEVRLILHEDAVFLIPCRMNSKLIMCQSCTRCAFLYRLLNCTIELVLKEGRV